jgi:hypothetical protein
VACHEAGAPNEDVFKIWATTAEKGNCDFVDTFVAVADKSNTTTVEDSAILVAFEGGIAEHAGISADVVGVIRSFIEDANAACVADGQCQPAGGLSGLPNNAVWRVDVTVDFDTNRSAVATGYRTNHP